ncbi:MAG: NAD(P)H-quinone oxidoreductase [Rhodocyclaceae bacterium]|jgi:NADPH2:quinone reductase|nr:NAD(P)H-quinone oxidoreductase [Rhodocyclaceae bacterium]
MMKAIEIAGFGGPDVLRLSEREIPVAREGEVLIRVAASGINRPDIVQREGRYPPPPGVSDLPGLEVAGEIVGGDLAHADNRFGLKAGQAVCALLAGGGYAEYCVAPVAQCLPLPRDLSMEEAASLPETYFTVWSNLFDRVHLGRNESGEAETLLVQGGTSGIGVAAIQIARAFGHRVFATAGSDEKCRAVEVLGAERGINYRREDFAAVVKALTAKRGVDVILDMVGGDYLQRELDCLAADGRIALIALLGGAQASIDLSRLLMRRLTVTGSSLRIRPVAFKGAIAAALKEKVWPLLESGAIRPVVHQVFPAAEAAAAHRLMESGAHIGKIVLRW